MPTPEERIDAVKEAMVEPIGVMALDLAASEIGRSFQEFEDLAQSLACIHLFCRMDQQSYSRNLQLCAFARRYQLNRLRAAAEEDPVFAALSRSDAILCAYIAGDQALAAELASLLPAVHQQRGEYRDDFHYACILRNLIVSGGTYDKQIFAAELEQFDLARESAEENRSALCHAFLEQDANTFWETFLDLLAEVQEERTRPIRTDEPWEELRRRLWLEGLTWIDFAEAQGMTSPQREYALCPFPARRKHGVVANPDFFADFPL